MVRDLRAASGRQVLVAAIEDLGDPLVELLSFRYGDPRVHGVPNERVRQAISVNETKVFDEESGRECFLERFEGCAGGQAAYGRKRLDGEVSPERGCRVHHVTGGLCE